MELRPLGFGEIFDRAVTLYIRNLMPFVGIVIVLVAPLAILQYLMDRNSEPQYDAMIRIFTHPQSAATTHMPSAFGSPGSVSLFVISLFVLYLIWPFALNAVAVGVGRLYRGRPVAFRACYAVVLRRWLQIIAMMLLQLCVIVVWYVVAVVVILILAVGVAMTGAISAAAAFWFGLALAIVGFAVMLPALAPLIVALAFGMYAIVIEERGVVDSFTLGFARVFNRAEFWRSLLFALAVGAVTVGASMMFSVVGIVAAVLHLPAISATIESIARAFISPFGVILLAIYYFDVRIRREGFDLEASLERLADPQAV